jgi:hypothetical protein
VAEQAHETEAKGRVDEQAANSNTRMPFLKAQAQGQAWLSRPFSGAFSML